MITCDEFLTEFGDYLENRASAEVREQLEAHLAQCHSCLVLYDSTLKTIKIVTDSHSFDLPADVSEPIVDSLMSKLRGQHGHKA
ncbi:MAG: anti-sigma factor family protein [Candidatus Acidiferrales bacterium]